MKQLIYLRHAKSSWKDFKLSDHDRPLNTRGKRDAPFMAIKLKELGIIPQVVFCSTSTRTRNTWTHFNKVFDLSSEKINFQKNLYHASQETLEAIIYEIDQNINRAMIIAHNPGLSILLDHYSKDPIDNVPTSGIFVFKSSCLDWTDFFKDPQVEHFIYPKKY